MSKESSEKPKPGGDDGGNAEGKTPRTGGVPVLLIAVLAFAAIFAFFGQRGPAPGAKVNWPTFLEEWSKGTDGNFARVENTGDLYAAKLKEPFSDEDAGIKDAKNVYAIAPATARDSERLRDLEENTKVPFVTNTPPTITTGQILLYLLGPMIVLGAIFYLMRRSSEQMGGGMLGNFAKSPAKRFHASEQGTTFADVAGMDNAKRDLEEVVEFLKNPEKFTRLGATIPKGVLLMGSPGTGKTLLARATAGEAGVPFFSINGSEFIQMFVGVGASRVRDMFKQAKESAPCVIFIDEIDAVGRERGAGLGGGHDEREQTLNQILGEMDGFTPSETVIVMAATNRPDILDPALLRPGRFDRHVQVDKPTKEGREGILKVHVRKVPLDDDVDLGEVASGTIGFSGAELKNLVNEAAILATRRDKSSVEMIDFDDARDKIMMGAERQEVLNEHERRMTAYHEAGHAVLAWLLPSLDPVHKVTIVPRGRALGLTQLLPDEETYHIGERRLLEQLAMMLGGRAAEKLVFDEYSAGAEDDINRATQLARRMVARWGMSDVIGPVAFRQGEEHPFLGKEMQSSRTFSEETARVIDKEIQRILFDAEARASDMLIERRADLDRLSEMLLDRENIGRDEMAEVLGEREAAPVAVAT
ncbi:MAG: ATP-dependent zinc metalloprotease FtsH [Planctomycetota bacterium]